jgi:hypothetical protein
VAAGPIGSLDVSAHFPGAPTAEEGYLQVGGDDTGAGAGAGGVGGYFNIASETPTADTEQHAGATDRSSSSSAASTQKGEAFAAVVSTAVPLTDRTSTNTGLSDMEHAPHTGRASLLVRGGNGE